MAYRLASAFEPVATTDRSGFDESLHYGAVVGLNADGSIAFTVGDVHMPVYPRSAMKPLQATAMVAAGLVLPARLLALVCSSHDGRDYQLQAARDILATAGLDETALQNTADYPLDVETAHAAIRCGHSKSSLQMNCSGKHSGMVCTCVRNGWPVETYLNPAHPLQQAINATVDDLAGERHAIVGVDGCGAPAHALSLVGLARAYRGIAVASDGPAKTVADAMRSHPEMVGGPSRDVTLLMQGIPGCMAKDGAEAVFACALSDGRAVALKIADGANRARMPVMQAALQVLGVDVSHCAPATFVSRVYGHGVPVGSVRVVGKLAELASSAVTVTKPPPPSF
jgi:L-asparaginase II